MTATPRDHDPLNAFVRRVARVRDEQLVSLADHEAQEALLQKITSETAPDAAVVASVPVPPARRRRVRRGLVVAVAALAVGGSVAAGWAALRGGSPHESNTVECWEPNADAFLDAVSGDPIADCARVWRADTGHEPPALIAYSTGRGGVVVAAKGRSVPDDFRPLPSTFTQDARFIELDASLADYVDGLHSGCFSGPAARALATGDLTRLKIVGWTVTFRGAPADGHATCEDFSLSDPVTQRVELSATAAAERASATSRFTILGAHLRAAFATCRPLAAAAAEVRAVGTQLGFSPVELQIQSVPDATATCTRIDMTVGGAIAVTLRGPN